MFQVNDDTRMLTQCWASTLINVLAHVPHHLGVVGPQDLNNNKVLTLAMVHRTHYEIFHYFYPHEFRNWYSDDRLSQVYGQEHTFMVDNVQMFNSNSQGTRYEKRVEVGKTIEISIDKGKRRIANWLEIKREEEEEEVERVTEKERVSVLSEERRRK